MVNEVISISSPQCEYYPWFRMLLVVRLCSWLRLLIGGHAPKEHRWFNITSAFGLALTYSLATIS